MPIYNDKILKHLIDTKQMFCFDNKGQFYDLQELLNQKLGYQVEYEEVKEILTGDKQLELCI